MQKEIKTSFYFNVLIMFAKKPKQPFANEQKTNYPLFANYKCFSSEFNRSRKQTID